MLVYAPVREAALQALDCALRATEPANCSTKQREDFDKRRGRLLTTIKALINGPFEFFCALAKYRQLFTRKNPWLPALNVLAVALAMGTQQIHRSLMSLKYYLANQHAQIILENLQDEEMLRPLLKRIDINQTLESEESKQSTASIDAALDKRTASIPAEDVKAIIKSIINEHFRGASSDAYADRVAFVRDLAADFELETSRRR